MDAVTGGPANDAFADPPYVEVRQVGRWTWHCQVNTGYGSVISPGRWVLGQRRAVRRARRMLADYLLAQQRHRDGFTIRVSDLREPPKVRREPVKPPPGAGGVSKSRDGIR